MQELARFDGKNDGVKTESHLGNIGKISSLIVPHGNEQHCFRD